MKWTNVVSQIALLGALVYVVNKIQAGIQIGFNASEQGEPAQGNIGFQILTSDSDDIGDKH